MKEEYFVNEAIDKAIKTYLSNINNSSGLVYNSFLVITIRILVLIYGRLDILNSYYLKDNVLFINNLTKYGMKKSDITLFKEEFLNYYLYEIQNEKQPIKKSNPYFLSTLKYLIDMFTMKKKTVSVSFNEEEEFLELAYTTHTKNPYRLSYTYLMEIDPNTIEKYYYSKLNDVEITREFSKTISDKINLDALNIMGIGLTNLENMDNEDIAKATKDAYDYFDIDAEKPNRDTKLNEAVDYFKKFGINKVTTGNGYVDILLLMSVIVTTISILVVLFFSL